jgi:preprotein translocase subunit YajC
MSLALHVLLAQADGAQPPQGGGQLLTFMPLVLIVILGYFLLMRPMRKQQREQQNMLAALKKNDKVITSGGLIGIVANVKDDEVTLKVDESSNVRLRVTKNSIVRVMREEESGKEQTEPGLLTERGRG